MIIRRLTRFSNQCACSWNQRWNKQTQDPFVANSLWRSLNFDSIPSNTWRCSLVPSFDGGSKTRWWKQGSCFHHQDLRSVSPWKANGRLSSIIWIDTVWVSTRSLQKTWRCFLVPSLDGRSRLGPASTIKTCSASPWKTKLAFTYQRAEQRNKGMVPRM